MKHHLSLVFHMPEAIVFWIVYVFVFFPELKIILKCKSLRSTTSCQDAGTVRLIVIGQKMSMLAGFAASLLPWCVMPWQTAFFIFGTCLMIFGSILRRICFRVLGQLFTGKVIVNSDQPVIDRGPYRWVRHPSYTGGLMMFVGIGMALGNWLSVMVLFIGPSLIYLRRVKVEERALLEIIGEPYRSYMLRTKRFIPFLV